MAEGTTKDDPFDWEVDRVIKELCTTDRTWRPTPNAKLPDPVILAEKLRDGEFDGELLLLSTEKDLWKHLSITKPKPQAALRCAINQFKRRSDNYKKWMKFIDDGTNDNTESDNDNHQSHRQQSDALQQAFTPISDIGGPASVPLAETAANDADAMELDQDLAEPESPGKKRRLALTAVVTTDRSSLPQGQYFNIATIPTEADNMSFLPAEADNTSFTVERPANISPLLNQAQSYPPGNEVVYDPSMDGELPAEDVEANCISKPGAYWGNGKLLKSDILSRSTTVDADPDVEFGWGRPKPFGKARKRYVRGIVQRHLLYPERSRKDPVLPAYGESENDAVASEWDEVDREVREEEEEALLEKEQALGLEPSEVDACLEKMIEECTATWHETELPKEKHKAHKLWHEVRRKGIRRTEVQVSLTKLREAEKALDKILQQLKDNRYSSEAELRLLSPSLEPRVMPIAHIKWLIGIFNSPTAPEKVARSEAPVQRKPKPASAEDSIDIWSEDELEDPMHDFIVDDVSAHELDAPRDDTPEHPVDVMDVDQSVSETPAGPTQSFTSSTDENIEMHDLTNIDHDSDVNDQVLPNLVIPRRSKPVPSPSHASPDSEEPPLSDWRAIVQKGSAHWESKRDVKRLIVNLIWTQPPAVRKSMFETVNSLERDDFWLRVIERHSKNDDGTYDKVEVQDLLSPHSLILLRRLFYVHVQACSSSSLSLRELDIPSLKWAIENKHYFGSFWEFLRSIVVRPGPPPSDNAQVQLTPAAQRKQRKRQYEDEQHASKQFRERDLRRQREQQARRLHLRKQVQGSEISQEQSRLIINESKLDGQNLVYIHPHIAPLIKDHQIDGVRFMWDQLLSDSNQGCLLAHTMGLGKTMQVITLLTAIQDAATSSDPKVSCQIPDHLKESSTLILCPSGLLNNWMDELLYWAPEGLLGELFSVEATLSEEERAATVRDWARRGGVLIIGYTMLTQIAAREDVLQLLLNKPSIVISDEAHTLKNQSSKISEIASRFQTHSRLALTGSPLANNVGEYYAMIEWVAPDFLGDKKGFNIAYTTPIAEGLYEDSSKAQRRKAKIRLAALRTLVAPKVHRRTVATLKDSLPPKKEFIIHVDIGSVQKDAYLTYLRGIQGKLKSDEEEVDVTSMWSLIKTLGPLLAHPSLLDAKLRDLQRRREQPKTKKGFKNSEGSVEVLPPQVVSDTLKALTAHQEYKELKTSFKMLALFKILDEAVKLGENVLVFSQSLHTLNFIQDVCIQQHRPFKRLDGSTKVAGRQSQVKDFNQGTGQVYLISTTAGGVGLNIYGANRVVIFDFSFNPVNEQQAIGRSYRIGQTKPVVVYWLICDGTFEKVLHNQQVFKNQLASGVVDKKDLLPKARQLKQYFAEPQQLQHEDLSAYRGRDSILDALIASSEISEGISSICTTETFEEEDTQRLPDEDQREAEDLARRSAKKMYPADEQVHYYHAPQQSTEEVRTVPAFPTLNPSIPPRASTSAPAASAAAVEAIPGAASSATVAGTRAGSVTPTVTHGPGSHPGAFGATSTTATGAMLGSVFNAPVANLAMQAPFAGYFHQGPSPQVPMEGQYPATNSAARVAPTAFTPAANREYNANETVNHFAPSVQNHRAPHWNQRYAMQHPSVHANGEQQLAQLSSTPGPGNTASAQSPPTNSTFSFGAMSQSVQLARRPVVTDGGTHHGTLTVVAPGDATIPQGMSPMTLGTAQMGYVPTTTGSGNASLLQDNAPIMMDATSRRDTSSKLDAGAINFRRELERQAPAQLRHQVPMVMTQLVQHFTGGRIQRNMAWNTLGNSIQNRPGRAEAILRGLVPLERVADYSRTTNPELGNLLDGAKPPSPPQGNRDTKDPDHTQRMLQRSIINDGKQNDESTRKAQDYAALREVLKKREPKAQKPQKSGKPRKVKSEKAERRRRTVSVAGPGSAKDPVVIDD